MRHALFVLLLCLASCRNTSIMHEPGSLGSPLAGLASPRAGVAKHESSWDRKGGNADFRPVEPGQTITLFDYQGAGVVHRFWCTIAPRAHRDIHRQAILRMYWDGSDTPAVECPIGDFFGVGFGEQKDYISLPLNQTSGGYNCYWPMPFHKSARWTLENRSGRRIDAFYYNIDFTAYDSLPADTRHFHAHWRRENPTKAGENYTVLDTTGAGHLVGVAMFMQARKPHGLGFLEGDEMINVDGETIASSVHETDFVGTGTEDYFSSGWYYDRGTYSAPYHGIQIKDEINARINTYRWHIEDTIPFTRSIRFTIEHGHDNDHEADYSSVAYFYASGDVKPAPPLPDDPKALLPLEPRVVKHFPNVIEAEALRDSASATGGQIQVQTMGAFHGEWSGEAQLFWVETSPGQSLSINVPVKDAGDYDVIGHFTRAPDYGVVRVQLGSGKMSMPIDLYDPTVKPSGPIALGRGRFTAGENKITFTITGKNESSTNTLVGIDAFELKRVR